MIAVYRLGRGDLEVAKVPVPVRMTLWLKSQGRADAENGYRSQGLVD
jgi:hypothetical protein